MCHIGKYNYLDIIDICDFFREALQWGNVKDIKGYRSYLKRVKKAEDNNSQLVYNSEFDNLPQMIMEIYDLIVQSGHELPAEDEYNNPYDFRNHILNYCIDSNQKEFGGLRYNTYTDFR